ncbi:MAG TPA: DUF3102 domain-containing protein [Gemmataceae bacterium]|nr:DUF3102 domain-containing protein [Gemmataceae bacterium]
MTTATAPKKKGEEKSKAKHEEEREAQLDKAARLVPGIKAAHKALVDALESSLEKAIEAGKHLAAAKNLVGHGGWHDWLKNNCGFSLRTASNYLRVYKRRDELPKRDDDSYRRAIQRLRRDPATQPNKCGTRPRSSIERARLERPITRYKINAKVDALRPLLEALGIKVKEPKA